MSAPFQPGDCVVCVDASSRKLSARPITPIMTLVRGAIYRVASAFNAPNGDPVVLLDGEAPHRFHEYPGQVTGWLASRFRKIDDEVTDEFRSMLRNLPVKQGEDA